MGFGPNPLKEWRSFVRASSHILKEYPSLLFQRAADEPSASAVSRAAEERARKGLESRPWLRWINKPEAGSGALMTLGEFGRGTNPSFAFSPDSSKIIVGGRESLIVWDVAAGTPKAELKGLGDAAQFYPNGALILVFQKNQIHICDPAAEMRIATIPGGPLGKRRARQCFFSAGGAVFVCESGADTLAVISSKTGETLELVSGTKDWLKGFILSPDGKSSLSGSGYFSIGYRALALWDLETKRVRAVLTGFGDITDYAFSPGGDLFVAGSSDGKVRICDAQDGRLVSVFEGCTGMVERCLFSPDGSRLVLCSSLPYEVKLWDVSSGKAQACLPGFTGAIHDCAFSPDSKHLVTAGGWEAPDNPEYAFGELLIWDLDQGELRVSFRGHTSEIWRCAFSPDGALLASASLDGTVKLWDTRARPKNEPFAGLRGLPRSGTLSFSGKKAGYAIQDRVEVWDMESGKLWREFDLKGDYLTGPGAHFLESCALSPDGERVAAVTSDGTAKIWRLSDAGEDAVLRVKRWLTSCSFSSDGRCLFLGDGAGNLLKWDVQNGAATPVFSLGHLTGGVARFTVAPDETMLASIHRDGTLRLLIRAENKEAVNLCPADKRGRQAVCCAISPDSKLLLAGYDDGKVRVWDIASRCELVSRKAHGEVVRAISFSHDGALFVTGSMKGHLRIWNAGSLDTLINDWLDGYPLAFAWPGDGKTLVVAHAAGASILEIKNL